MNLIQTILTDIKVELLDEFNQNFKRKAFFNRKWTDRKQKNAKGSLLMQSGKLRRSPKANIDAKSIIFTSDADYATIHNEGGEIKITKKMKGFFWHKFYELGGKVKYKKKERKASINRTTPRTCKSTTYFLTT